MFTPIIKIIDNIQGFILDWKIIDPNSIAILHNVTKIY